MASRAMLDGTPNRCDSPKGVKAGFFISFLSTVPDLLIGDQTASPVAPSADHDQRLQTAQTPSALAHTSGSSPFALKSPLSPPAIRVLSLAPQSCLAPRLPMPPVLAAPSGSLAQTFAVSVWRHNSSFPCRYRSPFHWRIHPV